MNSAYYELVGRKVVAIHPYIVKGLLKQPVLNDFDLIPEIAEFVLSHPIVKDKNKTRQKEYLIAAILKLYDPEMFEGYKKRMRQGLRQSLNNVIPGVPSFISNITSKVVTLIQVYRSFEKEIEDLLNDVLAEFEIAVNEC